MPNRLGDYIMVKVPGLKEPQLVPRGNMSDEEWDAIKRDARRAGSISGEDDVLELTTGQKRTRGKMPKAEWTALIRKADPKTVKRYTVDGFEVTPEGSPGAKGTQGENVVGRETGKSKPSGGKKLSELPDPGPEEWKDYPQPEKKPSTAKNTEDELYIGSRGKAGVKNPFGMLLEMALGATPESEVTAAVHKRNREPANPAPVQVDAGETNLAPVLVKRMSFGQPQGERAMLAEETPEDRAAAAARGERDYLATKGGSPINFAGEATPEEPSWFQKGLMRVAGAEPAGTDADPLDVSPGQPAPAAVVSPGVVPASPTPVAAPGQPGGSVSTKVAASGSGGGGGDYKDLIKRSQENTAALNAETERVALAQGEAAAKRASIRDENIAKDMESQANLARVQRDMEEQVNTRMSDYQSIMDEMRQVSRQEIDPTRYWKDKSAGQKVAATIAGALFGFTGQGMQWLQRLDNLVEMDIRAQMSDKNTALAGLTRAGQMGENLIGMARQKGLDGMSAVNAARAMRWASIEEQFLSIADNTSSQTAKSQALMAAAAANQKQVDFELKVRGEQQENAARWASVALQKQALAQKVAGGGEQIRGAQMEHINDVMSAIRSAKNMSQEFKNQASGFISKLTALDPTGTTGASQYNAQRDVVVQLVGRALEGGVLREGDIARYLKMIPSAGDLKGEERWAQLILELEDRLKTTVSGFAGAGYDVGSIPQQAAQVLNMPGGSRAPYLKPR